MSDRKASAAEGAESLASHIDHTLLKAQATADQVKAHCLEAARWHFASMCVNPYYVPLAAGVLAGSGVKVCTVVGFPLGATTTAVKVAETAEAVANGAEEIDVVINIGALKSGDLEAVRADVAAVVAAADGKALVKAIIETCFLSDEEKIIACQLCKQAGADFVKTSTGFGTGGATVEDIALIRRAVGPEMGIKASSGIRDAETANAMMAAGATRLGTSSSVAIVAGAQGHAAR
jgi:deoxyribose-phosphate aldolase